MEMEELPRILFNHLINDITACPISLCKSLELRKQYIDVLERRSHSLLYNNDLSYLVEYINTRIKDSFSIYNCVSA